MAVKTIDDNSFEEELEKKSFVLIDVYAVWCGPCQRFSRIFEKASEENPKFSFFKIDADENPKFRERVKIPALPFVVAFKDGEQVKQESMTTLSALKDFIQSL